MVRRLLTTLFITYGKKVSLKNSAGSIALSINKLTSLLVGGHHSPNPSIKEVIALFSSFQTKLAGVTFDRCQESIHKWGHQEIGYFSLEREPENPHDSNAIGVYFLHDRLGYLQKPVAEKLAPASRHG
jgi:hypothetical protein